MRITRAQQASALAAMLAALVVLVAAGNAASYLHMGGFALPERIKAPAVTIEMSTEYTFVPQSAYVSPGMLVVFHNSGTVPHDALADPANLALGGPQSDAAYPNGVPPDQSYSWIVPANAASGTQWFYHCRFHGTPGDGAHLGTGMAGVLIVK